MRTYYLNVQNKDDNPSYTLEESLRDKNKRRGLMMRYTIEELDNITSLFDSFQDMNEKLNEAYGQQKELINPIIIVDEDDNDLSKSYVIYDIVFSGDKKIINDPNYITSWLLDYLTKKPEAIYRIKGVRNIFQNKYSEEFRQGIINEGIITQIVHAYLANPSYKKYRDLYFALKKLDETRVKRK